MRTQLTGSDIQSRIMQEGRRGRRKVVTAQVLFISGSPYTQSVTSSPLEMKGGANVFDIVDMLANEKIEEMIAAGQLVRVQTPTQPARKRSRNGSAKKTVLTEPL